MKEHIKILDFLRGFAALGVVLFHFGNSTMPTIKPNLLSDLLLYGKYGVQVFFVISGFVIPFSMYKAKYSIKEYLPYIKKRFIRICPPSYVSILLSILVYYAAILILGRPINGMEWPGINLSSFIGNLTYTVPYVNSTWFNPVFWTLAIEFQFYILIGVLLPIFLRKNDNLTLLLFLGILALGFLRVNWFFKYGCFFVLGLILFLRKENLCSKPTLIIASLSTLIVCGVRHPFPAFAFGAGTFFLIASNIQLDFKSTNFLGKISYSLYITHWIVGALSEIILKRVISIHMYEAGKIVMLCIYTGIALVFATLFYQYIEYPFILKSKKATGKSPNTQLATKS